MGAEDLVSEMAELVRKMGYVRRDVEVATENRDMLNEKINGSNAYLNKLGEKFNQLLEELKSQS